VELLPNPEAQSPPSSVHLALADMASTWPTDFSLYTTLLLEHPSLSSWAAPSRAHETVQDPDEPADGDGDKGWGAEPP
jgi:hypothetical protein